MAMADQVQIINQCLDRALLAEREKEGRPLWRSAAIGARVRICVAFLPEGFEKDDHDKALWARRRLQRLRICESAVRHGNEVKETMTTSAFVRMSLRGGRLYTHSFLRGYPSPFTEMAETLRAARAGGIHPGEE